MKTTTKNGSLEDYKAGIDTYKDKIFTFRLTQVNANPSVVTGVDNNTNEGGVPQHFPPLVVIPATDTILHSGRRRNIKYVPGAKTIFVEDMTPEEKANTTNYAFKFVKGIKVVEGYDSNLLDYFMHTNWNTGNPDKITTKPFEFFLVDREAFFKKSTDHSKVLNQARTWCDTAPSQEIINYALPLMGVEWVNTKDVHEIRFNLKHLAEQNPEKFIKDKDSASTKRKGVVLQAILKKVLIANPSAGTVSWSSNLGEALSLAPIGIDTVDHFVAATFTPDGERIYLEVCKQLQPQVQAVMNPVMPTNIKPVLEVNHLASTDVEELVTELFEKGVVVKNGPAWIKSATNDKMKWTGKTALAQALKNEPETLATLKAELSKLQTA